jgi:uncharacterized protein YfaS (alpha-2-macroglobulin family)
MKSKFLVLLLVFASIATNAQQDFSALWKNVSTLEEQSLPQSALEIVNQIYSTALKERNSAELIKSLIYQLKYETAIDRDKLPEIICRIETFAHEDNNRVEQAVLYSLLAELYNNYYQANAYKINQRTFFLQPILTGEGVAGADNRITSTSLPCEEGLEEGATNFFIRKIADYVVFSLAPAQELQKSDVSEYKAILTEGESSRNLLPTLYDFLAHKGIVLLTQCIQNRWEQNYVPQILEIYRDWLTFRLQENNPQALLTVELERLKFIYQHIQTDRAGADYLEALQVLKKQYGKEDFCVEILAEEASYYLFEDIIALSFYEPDKEKERNKKVYEICTEGLQKYPNYERIGLLQNMLNQITQGQLKVRSDNAVYPGKELELKIHYRNFSELTLQIYKINAPVSVYSNDWFREGQYKKSGVLLQTQKLDLINDYPYSFSDTTIKIPVNETTFGASQLGNYEYVVYADSLKEQPVNGQFSVSRLATVSRSVDSQREFLVVDRLSGKPIEGAQIRFYKRENNSLEWMKNETLTTDKQGLAQGGNRKDVVFYQPVLENDTALVTSPVPWISTFRESSKNNQTLSLFTDRSIYRPGQTVYFKGIAYEAGENVQQVISKQSYTLTLYDAYHKEVAKKTFATNDFGSLAGEFVLPQGSLNGNFSISSDKNAAYVYFRVEEYKRPTFDIQFSKNENSSRFGDEITIKGEAKTFSGIALQETSVQYRITRQNHWMFTRRLRDAVQVAEGTIQTKNNGAFEITFVAEKAFEDKNLENVVYTYTVEMSLTDTNGETQNSQTYVHIGDKAMYINVEGLEEIVNKDNLPSVQIRTFNLGGNPIPVKGTYEIYSLKTDAKGKFDLESADWKKDKLIYSGYFEAGKNIDISILKSLTSGKYRLYPFPQGREGGGEVFDFVLTSSQDKRPPLPVYEWLMTPKTACFIGENAEIIYGSSVKNAYVLYEIFRNNKKLSAIRFILNNENRKIEIPYQEAYENGVTACFTFVKDGHVFTEKVNIYKKQPDKKLKLKMEVFRDKLLPGQKEEWKISVKDAGEKGIFSELLAGMYDASLDKIANHSWSFNPIPQTYLSVPNFNGGNELNTSNKSIENQMNDLAVPSFNFYTFNWFGWNIYSQSLSVLKFKNRGAVSDEMLSPSLLKKTMHFTSPIATVDILVQTESEEVQIRRDFNETAFFYPQLKTNEDGETLLSFTVPESNTTWKFMGLAHTNDLKYGQIIEKAISRKQLMITPNIPRFIRENDRTTITTNISNLSETTISGTIVIECFDPNTNQINIVIAGNSKEFTLDAGKTAAVSWSFNVPSGIDLTALKIVACSSDFSDGEQHLISVLPNRMLVTESMPLNISGEQKKTFSFDKIGKNNSPSLENYRLTLEFTGNPLWYAVQALPTLTAPQSENVLSWFAAYYSNALSVRIAGSNPKIKSFIDIWMQQSGTKETLLSNLEKNQELKTVLLEETPWLLQASNETEQKQRLISLFDSNRANYLTGQSLEKLQSLQTDNGGWAWFKGMNASVSITQWLLYGMGKMEEKRNVIAMTQPSEDLKKMQEKALQFIDRKFREHYENFRKRKPSLISSLTSYELEFLLVRSLYKEIPFGETEEAVRFYTSIAEKYWAKNPNLYDRAITAMILQRNGNTKTALSIVKSLREHASRKPDLGMFWANNNTHAFLFQSAVCVHTFIMEAFQEVGTTTEEMDEMKRWLLKQKQTQEWESVPATVNAIDILLKTGSNWLENEGKTSIRLGDKTIDTQQSETGTGYIKEVYNANDITADMKWIEIFKEDATPGWGALYWQYFEDLDKITPAKTGLNVEKSLFIEKITTTGKAFAPITDNNPLRVGDKVLVHLTVRSDRDIEYVHLKDMRASCFEPAEQLSGIRWTQGLVYYQSPKDVSMNYYFDRLPKGTYVFEYPLYVTSVGDYSNGITSIQCLYAPEFVSHTSGGRVVVK